MNEMRNNKKFKKSIKIFINNPFNSLPKNPNVFTLYFVSGKADSSDKKQ